MALPIEEYGLIGDTETAALVGSNGSVDWLCLPRFDSPAVFAGLLGDDGHGHWSIAPIGGVRRTTRRYVPDTLVLETTFHADDGVVRLIDLMPPRGRTADVVRIVEGVEGRVPMRMDLVLRFDYGSTVPWLRRTDGSLTAIAGPDAVFLETPVPTRGAGLTTVADFVVQPGDRVPFVLGWHPSHEPVPDGPDAERALRSTIRWWRRWSRSSTYDGEWRDEVMRSLITLKALTFAPTGGIVAAPTTSLPEKLGGVRNWDYRYCWLRDATFTLYSLLAAGYEAEAAAWRDWLLRAAAGNPEKLQIMYGVRGERRLQESSLGWLPGYQGSAPVRVGNAAHEQFQLDVYGEVLDSLHQTRRVAAPDPEWDAWPFQKALLDFLEGSWQHADEGIWEVRGARQHFTHSKVMAWVAFDRAVRSAEDFDLDGPVERWKAIRDEIHAQVCDEGFDAEVGAFTQAFGSRRLDAAVLMIPLVGFLPADDPRVVGTIDVISTRLVHDGFVLRYDPSDTTELDGLPPGEGAFLPCSFWLVDNLALMGRRREAADRFERLLDLRNDVGLLSEEYDPTSRRLVGNFPQAFTHVSLIDSAANLSVRHGPAAHRGRRGGNGDERLSGHSHRGHRAPG